MTIGQYHNRLRELRDAVWELGPHHGPHHGALLDAGEIEGGEGDPWPDFSGLQAIMNRCKLPESDNPIVRHIARTGFTC
jgi:hypothetical protein